MSKKHRVSRSAVFEKGLMKMRVVISFLVVFLAVIVAAVSVEPPFLLYPYSDAPAGRREAVWYEWHWVSQPESPYQQGYVDKILSGQVDSHLHWEQHVSFNFENTEVERTFELTAFCVRLPRSPYNRNEHDHTMKVRVVRDFFFVSGVPTINVYFERNLSCRYIPYFAGKRSAFNDKFRWWEHGRFNARFDNRLSAISWSFTYPYFYGVAAAGPQVIEDWSWYPISVMAQQETIRIFSPQEGYELVDPKIIDVTVAIGAAR